MHHVATMALRSLSSISTLSRFSKLAISKPIFPNSKYAASLSYRYFTNGGKDEDDPFGLNFEPGENNLGTKLPPNYVRDKTTGKFTGEIVSEISPDALRLLTMDEDGKEMLLSERLKSQLKNGDDMSNTLKSAESIAIEEMSLHVIGRLPSVQALKDDQTSFSDDSGLSKPLTHEEYKSFSHYFKKQHGTAIPASNIPISGFDSSSYDPDNPDLDLKWMSSAAQNEMDGLELSDPMASISPSDMSPTRLVNRKRAKPIPKELLHHNNLALLRRYVSPSGRIKSRAQSRLGAKDQRKVAKLIKRARCLGLIPFIGQWKYETHGNIYEHDIHEDREWEVELVRRGLVKKE
jgi:small subunit ribosomal protein S18